MNPLLSAPRAKTKNNYRSISGHDQIHLDRCPKPFTEHLFVSFIEWAILLFPPPAPLFAHSLGQHFELPIHFVRMGSISAKWFIEFLYRDIDSSYLHPTRNNGLSFCHSSKQNETVPWSPELGSINQQGPLQTTPTETRSLTKPVRMDCETRVLLHGMSDVVRDESASFARPVPSASRSDRRCVQSNFSPNCASARYTRALVANALCVCERGLGGRHLVSDLVRPFRPKTVWEIRYDAMRYGNTCATNKSHSANFYSPAGSFDSRPTFVTPQSQPNDSRVRNNRWPKHRPPTSCHRSFSSIDVFVGDSPALSLTQQFKVASTPSSDYVVRWRSTPASTSRPIKKTFFSSSAMRGELERLSQIDRHPVYLVWSSFKAFKVLST